MKSRGAVMVLTLAVLTGLVTVLAAAAATQRLAFRAGVNRLEDRRSAITADAACQFVLANLVDQSKTRTTLQDDWASLGSAGDERFTFGDQSFRIEVLDAGSRINLNTVTQGQLQQMNLTVDQIDSLLDWKQAGQTARTNGAKDQYYNSLPDPYNTALRSFHTVDELLLVKGFTAADLFRTLDQQEGAGASTTSPPASANGAPTPVLYDLLTVDSVSQDVRANGQPKMAINAATTNFQALLQIGLPPNLAGAILQRRNTGRPFTSMAQVLAVRGVTTRTAATILDNLSITGAARVTGRLDLNTATPDALSTLPNITPDMVQAIVQQQATGFTGVGQLASVPGMTVATLQNLADAFSVNSQAFDVRILAEAGGLQKAFEATVNIEGTVPKIVRMEEAPEDSLARWGWAADAGTDTPVDQGGTQ